VKELDLQAKKLQGQVRDSILETSQLRRDLSQERRLKRSLQRKLDRHDPSYRQTPTHSYENRPLRPIRLNHTMPARNRMMNVELTSPLRVESRVYGPPPSDMIQQLQLRTHTLPQQHTHRDRYEQQEKRLLELNLR